MHRMRGPHLERDRPHAENDQLGRSSIVDVGGDHGEGAQGQGPETPCWIDGPEMTPEGDDLSAAWMERAVTDDCVHREVVRE